MQALKKIKSLFSSILQNNDNQEMLERIIALMPGHVYWINYQGFYLSCDYNQTNLAGLYSSADILEPISIASGDFFLHEKFSLDETLTNVINFYQPLAIQKKLGLALNIDKAIPKYLIGDSIKIYCIILELLANALKFTHKGEVNIVAILDRKAKSDVVIKILVKDTGIGISDKKLSELFVHFKCLTFSCGVYKGLSLVKQFIGDLKGEIHISSTPRKGSNFECVIPLKIPLLAKDLFNA